MACVATHFDEYRATAIGIVSAGSGCGNVLSNLMRIITQLGLGGVFYSIVLRCLFSKVGFGWTVRISALMTAILCAVAILTVRLQHPINKKTGAVWETRIIKDRRFLFLVSGSFFVCLGVLATPAMLSRSSSDPA